MSEELCRLCGKDTGLTNVFEESGLCLKISTCFGIKIHQEDVISKNICKSCYFSINYFYEFRISAIAHDTKLQKEYAERHPEAIPISYPSEISQNAFLNTLNLANKNDVSVSKPVLHPSVLNLKRKYPNINLPTECYTLNIDPEVMLDSGAKVLKLNDLGIWSVKNKHLRSKQPDLILTRVRGNNISKNSSKDKDNYQVTVKSDEALVESPSKKKKKKNSQWVRRKKQIKRSPSKTSEKTSSTKTTEEEVSSGKVTPIKLCPEMLAPGTLRTLSFKTKTETSNDSEITAEKLTENIHKKYKENILQRLLHTDPNSLTLPEVSKTIDDLNTKSEEYGNLLVSVGEEVQTFICQTCNQIFDTLISLNNHKKYNHKSSLRCTKCSKRFSIVESLVQHNLTYHPETNEPIPSTSSANLKESKETVPLYNVTARKRTNGGFVPMFKGNTAMDINTISSDSDDNSVQEIGFIISDDNKLSAETSKNTSNIKENVSQKSMEKRKKNKEMIEIDLFCDDVLCIDSDDDVENKKTKSNRESSNNCASSTSNNNGTKSVNSKESDECFLITDESNSSNSKSMDAEIIPINATENKQLSTIEIENNNTETNVCQKIVVVPSAEDKEHMEAASSIKAKITNELSYINYIFNKCSFSERPKNEKKWYLRDIHKFTEKTYLPIEVVKSTNKELSVEYTPAVQQTPCERLAFWDTANAIDIPVNRVGLDKPILSNRAKEAAKKYFSEKPQNEKIKATPVESPASLKPTEIIKTPTSVSGTNVVVSNAQDNANVNVNTPTTFGIVKSVDKAKTDDAGLVNNIQGAQMNQNTSKSFNILQIPTSVVANSLSKPNPGSMVLNPTVGTLPSNKLAKKTTADIIPGNCKVNPKEHSVQLHNGFILMGLKTDANGVLKPTGDSAYLISEVDKTNSISLPKQPIIINGLSYPSLAKMKNSAQSTLVLQQVGQQTNSNSSNCVNVIQQDVTNEQNPIMPPLQPISACAIPVPKNLLDTTSDSTVTSTKPMIRIKNLSELQDDAINAHQRQQLHTSYTTALSNYVQNHSTTLISQPANDEYLQIS